PKENATNQESRALPIHLKRRRSGLDAGPAVPGQPLLRQEAALVVHLLRALHPIAEIDVGQAEAARARNVIEDDEGAERTSPGVGIEERIDHRETVAEHVGEGDAEQWAVAAPGDAA